MGNQVDQTRRNFLRGRRLTTSSAIRLPWVKGELHFVDNCSQCGDCASKCPENIIAIGAGGFPEVDFNKGECTFCQECVKACREPLFTDIDSDPAWQLELRIKDNCLAYNKIHCQSCQDSCETEAIRFKYLTTSIPQPVIEQEDCTSCGACISVCPQSSISLIKPDATAESVKAMVSRG